MQNDKNNKGSFMDSFINPKMFENLQKIYDGEQHYFSFFFLFIILLF